jgi:alkylation response protein AidB-like acyl-CoA dehydrogenase
MSGLWPGPPLEDEERALVELVDTVAAKEMTGVGAGEAAAIADARATLAGQGLWALGAPESIGGGGAPLRTVLIALQRLARVCPALALACAHANACAVLLAHRPAWRDAGAEVTAGATAALVEAPGLSTTSRYTAVVSRVDVGTPRPLLLLAEGNSVAIVPATMDGSQVWFDEPTVRTGLAGAATRSVHLHDAALDVDPDAPVGAAFTVLRLCTAAVANGITAAATEAAADYTRQRHQFGGPLREIPTVAAAVQRCERRVRQGLYGLLSVAGGAAPGEHDAAAATAVLHSALADAVEVSTTAIQLHGGYGYLAEYPPERLFRDAISLRAAAGQAR